MKEQLAFDRTSQRRVDENGFLHVAATPISKEAVNEYYGREIPGWQGLGLDAERIYLGYRPGRELAEAASTFNGLPLLKEHVPISAEDLPEELRAGNLGTSAVFSAPYLYNGLIIQDADSIQALDPEDPAQRPRRGLSCAYRYDPVFKPGRFNGQAYDFMMTNIRGNHVALVEEGRAGPDVLVADEKPQPLRGKAMDFVTELKKLIGRAEAQGAPSADGETPTRQDMKEEQDAAAPAAADQSPAERAAALINTLEDKELADFLKVLLEGVAGQGAEDEEGETLHGKNGAEDEDGDAPQGPVRLKDEEKQAMDSAALVRREIRAVARAVKKVEPLVGTEMDLFAFDSAPRVYAEAMRVCGMDPGKYAPVAYEGIVDALLRQRAEHLFPSCAGSGLGAGLTMDGASAERAPQFKHLAGIRH